MQRLPTGTVTFFFADIEGSTRLLERLSQRYARVLADYSRMVRAALAEQGGYEVDTQGDSLFAAFARARDAVAAAVAVQRHLQAHTWPDGARVQARIGLHTGEPWIGVTGYIGIDVHRAARIAAAGHGGQILISESTKAIVEHNLPEAVSVRDLGSYRLKDLARPHRLFQVVAPDLPSDFPPLRTLDVLPNNLPAHLTTFVGRERDISELKRLLDTGRLVTLTGAGGSGKTRLALQAAAELLDRYPEGVWFVDLSPLTDARLVPQALASTLRVSEEGQRPLVDALADALRQRSMLVILDNCEHVIAASAALAASLLPRCSALRVLATSREPLGITGEVVWPVSTLAVPDPAGGATLAGLAGNEAVRLFIDRACAMHPAFALTEANAPSVSEICRRLDGIPLAIEFAAARVRLLAVDQIAAKLNDRFRLLTVGSRTATPRHQTLRAAFDWSYDLLPEEERIVFRRLAVFAGGFSLEAAEAVCADREISPEAVLDLLAHLVDKSLVLSEGLKQETRYGLLETVRQYAAGKLQDAGESPVHIDRHAEWCVQLAEDVEPRLRAAGSKQWLDRLDTELDNLRAAMAWARTSDNPAVGLRIAAALGVFWDVRGRFQEGRQWLEEMLAHAPHTLPGLRAKALNWAATLAYRQGDYPQVRRFCTEALELSKAHRDAWNAGLALHYLGHMAQAGGDFDEAARCLQESVDLFRGAGDTWGLAYSLNCLGDVARNRGAGDRARALLEEALARWREIGFVWGLAVSSHNLGHVVLKQGDFRRARELFTEGLAAAAAGGSKPIMIYSIAGLAGAAAGESQWQRAARLFGAAEALFAKAGMQLEPADRNDYEQNLSKVRAGLDVRTFNTAWNSGQSMSLDEAAAFALSAGGPTGRGPDTPR